MRVRSDTCAVLASRNSSYAWDPGAARWSWGPLKIRIGSGLRLCPGKLWYGPVGFRGPNDWDLFFGVDKKRSGAEFSRPDRNLPPSHFPNEYMLKESEYDNNIRHRPIGICCRVTGAVYTLQKNI